MLQLLKLFLPILIPSWRFFDVIAPSPRIEYRHLQHEDEISLEWQELYPRPANLTFLAMLKRLIWNPHWNETLYLMGCAERLMNGEEQFARQEIFERLQNEIHEKGFVQFRIIFYAREEGVVQRHHLYTSPLHSLNNKGIR